MKIPSRLKGAQVNAEGRAIDSDGDGVPDHADQEASTPKGSMVNFKGVNLSSSIGGQAYLPSLYFSFNSAKLPGANDERLATIALAMKNNSGLNVKLVGHTDASRP
ncbi:MAG: hypothetical protein U5L96_14890 [Owenweeksia sp.]|nr:hypothetical protein [Owenweeksia sp.]